MQSPARSIEDIFEAIGGEPNSCTHEEYYALANRVRNNAPCRLLVFGVGRDSSAWIEANHEGTTQFIENDPEWIAKVGEEIDPSLIAQATYHQSFEDWEETGCSADHVKPIELSGVSFDHSWDVVFVDAPWGPTWGRHQSTNAAAQAVTPGGLVSLHDCDREGEQLICEKLLESRGFVLEEEIDRLRIYRAPS